MEKLGRILHLDKIRLSSHLNTESQTDLAAVPLLPTSGVKNELHQTISKQTAPVQDFGLKEEKRQESGSDFFLWKYVTFILQVF